MIEEKIIQILNQIVEDDIKIDENTKIIEEVGLDSIQVIKFILMIEEAFDFEIDFDSFDVDVLTTVKSFAKYIYSYDK